MHSQLQGAGVVLHTLMWLVWNVGKGLLCCFIQFQLLGQKQVRVMLPSLSTPTRDVRTPVGTAFPPMETLGTTPEPHPCHHQVGFLEGGAEVRSHSQLVCSLAPITASHMEADGVGPEGTVHALSPESLGGGGQDWGRWCGLAQLEQEGGTGATQEHGSRVGTRTTEFMGQAECNAKFLLSLTKINKSYLSL